MLVAVLLVPGAAWLGTDVAQGTQQPATSNGLLALTPQCFLDVSDFAFGFAGGVTGVRIALRGAGLASALGLSQLLGTAALGGVLGGFDSGHLALASCPEFCNYCTEVNTVVDVTAEPSSVS